MPQSVSILGEEDPTVFNAERVSETLRYTPGVTADVFGNDRDYDWLRIRGFQAEQTGVFLDNAQNLSFAFGSFWIDPYAGFSSTPVDADGTFALVGFEHDTLVRTAQTDLRYYGTVGTGAVTHDLLVGLDARYYEIDEVQASPVRPARRLGFRA